ncbi:hypothetical protein CLAFUR4_12449 [Fulvia fulva]|nr:hypothetical protein CLAFUR4_12449 [Fulvia fulva]
MAHTSDECGVAGYIDTCKLAVKALGHKGNPRSLLKLLRIPCEDPQLHSAGHDAYYTMLTFLATIKQMSPPLLADPPSGNVNKLNRLISRPRCDRIVQVKPIPKMTYFFGARKSVQLKGQDSIPTQYESQVQTVAVTWLSDRQLLPMFLEWRYRKKSKSWEASQRMELGALQARTRISGCVSM